MSNHQLCTTCQIHLSDAVSARAGLCRVCAFPTTVARVRRLLADGPRDAGFMLRMLEGFGYPPRWAGQVRNAADIAVRTVGGDTCWALPQHQRLRTDDAFHRELCRLLDVEAHH